MKAPLRIKNTHVPAPVPNLVRAGFISALVLLVVQVLWCMVWESQAAPLRPGGTWLILKGLPLLFWVPGLLRCRVRTLQALTLAILVYLLEGLTRLFSDLPSTRWAAGVAALNALVLWIVCLYTIRRERRTRLVGSIAAVDAAATLKLPTMDERL